MTELVTLPAPPRLSIEHEDGVFPVARVFCIGRNYAEHAAEMGEAPEPIFFMKPADAVTAATEVNYPPGTADLHHEAELVLALGDGGEIVACGVGIDLTKRDVQARLKAKGAPWEPAKSFPDAAPVGPLRRGTPPATGTITLTVNGTQRQSGDLSQMILKPDDLLAELSRHFRLGAGDLVFTGTPAGVSALEPGDRVEAHIDGLPSLGITITGEKNP